MNDWPYRGHVLIAETPRQCELSGAAVQVTCDFAEGLGLRDHRVVVALFQAIDACHC